MEDDLLKHRQEVRQRTARPQGHLLHFFGDFGIKTDARDVQEGTSVDGATVDARRHRRQERFEGGYGIIGNSEVFGVVVPGPGGNDAEDARLRQAGGYLVQGTVASDADNCIVARLRHVPRHVRRVRRSVGQRVSVVDVPLRQKGLELPPHCGCPSPACRRVHDEKVTHKVISSLGD